MTQPMTTNGTPAAAAAPDRGGDPRVRLLGGLAGPASSGSPEAMSGLLDALDDIEVRVVVGDDIGDGHVPALLVLAGMCARIFGDVTVDRPVRVPRNWWDVDTIDQMITAARRVRPAAPRACTRAETITFGAVVSAEVLPGDAVVFGVGGSDWIAGLSTGPLPCRAVTHGLGLHAAACLAVGQLLTRVLARAGYAAEPAAISPSGYALDLLSHRPLPDPSPASWPDTVRPGPGVRARTDGIPTTGGTRIALAGVGSVGTSTAALLASALSPGLFSDVAGTDPVPGLEVTCIDADTIDTTRNPFRYPALTGTETGAKASAVAARLAQLGIPAHGHQSGVADWVTSRPHPGFAGILVSSVDTLGGRLDVADVLARETLSVGIAGLSLHVQREHLGDGLACPFCDYVTAEPPATQAQVHADLTGLPVERVLQLVDQHTVLTADDIALVIAAGRVPAADAARLAGARLEDLLRGAYAEAALHAASSATPGNGQDGGALAVAAPHVSWMAGTLAAAEIVKDIAGLPRLDRRVDLDLAGLPPGLVRRRPADPTGRCVCRGAVRARWMRRLYL